MISVFTGYMLAKDPIIKSMGFARAFGILFDAFVVRADLKRSEAIRRRKSCLTPAD